jgi:RNase adaptor protein for sRNA GlmZ degradation
MNRTDRNPTPDRQTLALATLRRWREDQEAVRPDRVAAAWRSGVRNVAALSRAADVARDTIYADLTARGINYRNRNDEGDTILIRVVIDTFGVLHGPAPTGDALTVDLRDRLRNPPDDPAVRDRMVQQTGLDEEVRDYVLATPGADQVVENTVERTLVQLNGYADARHQLVRLHIFCQGGRHRSVAIAEEVAARLRAQGVGTETTHRDINKPVVTKK